MYSLQVNAAVLWALNSAGLLVHKCPIWFQLCLIGKAAKNSSLSLLCFPELCDVQSHTKPCVMWGPITSGRLSRESRTRFTYDHMHPAADHGGHSLEAKGDDSPRYTYTGTYMTSDTHPHVNLHRDTQRCTLKKFLLSIDVWWCVMSLLYMT